jgi:hypothetical protein
MRRRTVLSTLLLVATPLVAQQPDPNAAPAMLWANCQTAKAGKQMVHDQAEAAWARAAERIPGLPAARAVQAVTGLPVTCWLANVASFAEVEKTYGAMMSDANYAAAVPAFVGGSAEYIEAGAGSVRGTVAIRIPELDAGTPVPPLERRFLSWTTWQIRPGQEELFTRAAAAYKTACERVKAPCRWAVYAAYAGAPTGTYWVLNPLRTLAELDAILPEEGKVMAGATPAERKLFEEFFAKAVVSSTTQMYTYNPKLSILSPAARGNDPFWRVP